MKIENNYEKLKNSLKQVYDLNINGFVWPHNYDRITSSRRSHTPKHVKLLQMSTANATKYRSLTHDHVSVFCMSFDRKFHSSTSPNMSKHIAANALTVNFTNVDESSNNLMSIQLVMNWIMTRFRWNVRQSKQQNR